MTLAASTFTITMGWWIFPAMVTAVSIIAIIWTYATEPKGFFGTGILTIVVTLFFAFVSCFAWLIWSLFCR
jgi:hypothetical protein